MGLLLGVPHNCSQGVGQAMFLPGAEVLFVGQNDLLFLCSCGAEIFFFFFGCHLGLLSALEDVHSPCHMAASQAPSLHSSVLPGLQENLSFWQGPGTSFKDFHLIKSDNLPSD